MTYSSEIISEQKFSFRFKNLEPYYLCIVKSFSQLFFTQKTYVGLCFIIFTAWMSYQATLCAILGAVVANVTSYLLYPDSKSIRASGGVGYNCCIIGLYLTQFVYFDPEIGIISIIWMSALTVIINRRLHGYLYKKGGFPALSLSAVLVIIFAHIFYRYAFNIEIINSFSYFYDKESLIQFYIGYMFFFMLCSLDKSVIVVLVTLPVMFWSLSHELNLAYLIINLANVSYASAAYFLKDTKYALSSSIFSSFICVLIYTIGYDLFLRIELPMLLLPAILSLWITFYFIVGRSYHLPITNECKQVAKLLENNVNKRVTCLSGAGTSTTSGIPDYTSSVWLEKDIPIDYYYFNKFLKSRAARVIYYNSCHKFMKYMKKAKVNTIHKTLSSLQKAKYIDCFITQNVDGLLQSAGCTDVVEIHGQMDHLHCLRCNSIYAWPEKPDWKEHDIICKICDGLVKPAVCAYGEPVNSLTWKKAVELINSTDILIIMGTRMLVGTVTALLDIARERGVQVVILNDAPVAISYFIGDTIVYGRLEQTLPTINLLIDNKQI